MLIVKAVVWSTATRDRIDHWSPGLSILSILSSFAFANDNDRETVIHAAEQAFQRSSGNVQRHIWTSLDLHPLQELPPRRCLFGRKAGTWEGQFQRRNMLKVSCRIWRHLPSVECVFFKHVSNILMNCDWSILRPHRCLLCWLLCPRDLRCAHHWRVGPGRDLGGQGEEGRGLLRLHKRRSSAVSFWIPELH